MDPIDCSMEKVFLDVLASQYKEITDKDKGKKLLSCGICWRLVMFIFLINK